MKKVSFFKYFMLFFVAVSLVGFYACSDDDDDVEPDPPPVFVEDGMYVKGDGTALPELAFEGLMLMTRNEVTQEDRPELLELFIAVEGGSAGFHIVSVEGATQTVFGPGGDFAYVEVEDRINDEPKTAGLWRGSLAETDTPFTVPEDGLYHVVVDTEFDIVMVAHIEHWGLIGGATPGGWAEDTPLLPLAFDLETITFEVTNAAIAVGEFKFRYSNGWKVVINDDADVRVNSNYGGTIDELIPGGPNIPNDEAGFYTVHMIWTLGQDYDVVMEKTGEMGQTDWTGVELDVVGLAVSDDNEDAIPDPSAWGWGNVMYPEPNEPVVDGTLFTWTWDSVILEAEDAEGEPAGFKVRTKNGEAPPEGGANFDSGFGDVDVDNSSANVADLGGDISVTVKGAYKITITIDAADSDAKVITITEVE